MQTWSQGIMPLFLAISGFWITTLIYPEDIEKLNFTVPFLAAAALLGWSSTVLHSKQGKGKFLKFNIILTIFIVIGCSEFFSYLPGMLFWKRVIAIMILVGMAGLRQFVINTDIRKTGDESFRKI